ncbi:putative abc multidrug transporter protein [Neofusicoccum parvum]|uniref:Abc multidrug transporter protein n=1 Tax=Neofusicoccum parvum TaxID=310453 RepID=A0ACB5SPM6_9PEZI|nr:putative abc multidrug transporter protein [Neofusicoccum parvum]
MAFKLFEKKAAADDVQPSPPETANPASVEPKSEINETAEPVHSDRGDDDKNEEHMFHGVAEMEAITSAWTTKSMLIAYALIYLNHWAMSMLSMTYTNLLPYVTSDFKKHGLLTTTNVVASIVGGVCRLPIAKIIDIWGRVEGFLLMVLIMVIGLIMMAVCNDVQTYSAATVFYRIGYTGIGYVIDVFIADTSSLRNRALIMAVNSTPYLATAFAGPAAAERFYYGAGWRWGFGVFAIVIPAVCLPMAFLFMKVRKQARDAGFADREVSGRTFWESTKYYFVEFDVIGMLLITAGWSLLLLPLTIATYQAEKWQTPYIIAMIVLGGVLNIAFGIWEKWFSPVSFVPFHLLVDRTVLPACLLSSCLFIASSCWSSYFSSFLQVALYQSISQAGYVGSIYSLGSCVWAFATGSFIRYTNHFKWLAMVASPMTVLAAGLFIKYRQPGEALSSIIGCQIFMTVGAATLVVCEQMAVMTAAAHANVAVVIALLSLFTNIGSGIGYGISGALWTNLFPQKLKEGLPQADAATIAKIYGSLVVQKKYAKGTAMRDGIVWAYGVSMKYQSIAGMAILILTIPLVACWRDYNVKETRRNKGRPGSAVRRLASKVVNPAFFSLLLDANPEPFDVSLLVTGLIVAVAAGMPFPLLCIYFGKLVDDLNSSACIDEPPASLEDMVRRKVIIVALFAVANFVTIYVYMGCWTLFGERIVRRLRTRYLTALLRQEAAYFDTLPAGEVAARLDSDLHTIQQGVSEKVGIYIASVSNFLTAYAVAFVMDSKLALILFVLVPAYYAMVHVGKYFSEKYSKQVNEAVGEASSLAAESLSNIQVVQAFRLESRLEAIFAGHLLKVQPAAIRKFVAAAIQLGFLFFVAHAANSTAVWMGSKQIAESIVADTGFTFGRVYTCLLVMINASFMLTQVSPFLTTFSSAAAVSTKLLETIDRHSQIDGTSDFQGHIPSSFNGEIEFRDVTFEYPSRPGATVLNKLSLSIEAKKTTAIVGSSGSGKSTLASLIPRIYDVDGGEIFVDDTNVNQLNARFLRSNIAIVQQNPSLFDVSILENIAFGLVGSARRDHAFLREGLVCGALGKVAEAVQNGSSLEAAAETAATAAAKKVIRLAQDAAQRAGVMDFAGTLEHGLATRVGPGGSQLSGGQKQRVAIARALIRDAPVLILDEATSALDSASEKAIQASLEETCKGKTVIMIAHRLSTVRKADKIIAMAKGKVVEEGSYDELLQKGGLFASLVRAQDIESQENREPLISMSSGEASSAAYPEKDMTDIDMDSDDDDEDLPLLESQETKHGKLHPKEQDPSFLSTFVSVVGMSRPWRSYVFIGVLAATIVGCSHSGEALIFGNMIGRITPCRGEAAVRWAGIFFSRMFFLLAVANFSANVVRGTAFGYVAEKVLVKTRILTLRSLLHHDVAWHESDGRTPDTLLAQLTTDTNSLSGMTGSVLGIAYSIVVSLGLGIIIAHIVAWKIAIVLLATVPVLLAAGFMRLRALAQFHQKHAKAFTQSVAVAKEAVDCIQTVAAFAMEDLELNVYRRALKAPYDATLRGIFTSNFWLALSFSITNLIYALAYWWGAKQTANGNYTQTQFFIVLPALLFSAQSCGQFFSLAPDISRAGVAARRILGLIEKMPPGAPTSEYQDSPAHVERFENTEDENAGLQMKQFGRRLNSGLGVSVSFADVRFSYPSRPNVEVLKGLDIHIKANQFVALTGHSGSGKSTTFALLERFYQPTSGSVKLDGKDISHTEDVSFRDDIALVPQQSVLFDGTVAFNISLGAPAGVRVSQKDIEEACKAANIHDTITSLPEGYNTRCGHHGNQFSGGQLQRLSIARALLRKPRLLLLDEPTSALDAESERIWQATLDRISRDMTVIVIAHRLATIRKADVIFLVEGGRCVDSGSHDELLLRCESYKSSVMHQTLR